jgi:hypothetical protein
MVRNWGSAERLIPDYTIPAPKAIKQAVHCCLQVESNLQFLYGLRTRRCADPYYSSWLADFHVRSTESDVARVEQKRWEMAQILRSEEFQDSAKPELKDDGILRLRGARVSTVSRVGDVCNPQTKLADVPAVLKRWMGMVLEKSDVEWPNLTPENGSPHDSFWGSIINNCAPDAETGTYKEATEEHYKALKATWVDLDPTSLPDQSLSEAVESSQMDESIKAVVENTSDEEKDETGKAVLTATSKEAKGLAYNSLVCLWGRRMIVTEDGLVGLAPGAAMKGDIVCRLSGSQVPFIIRHCCDEGPYHTVGDVYIHELCEKTTNPAWEDILLY